MPSTNIYRTKFDLLEQRQELADGKTAMMLVEMEHPEIAGLVDFSDLDEEIQLLEDALLALRILGSPETYGRLSIEFIQMDNEAARTRPQIILL